MGVQRANCVTPKHIAPHLSKANHGYVSEQPLYKLFNYMLYQRYTGCPRAAVPIQKGDDGQPVMSYQVPYYHFRKWSKDGSLQGLCDAGIISIKSIYAPIMQRWVKFKEYESCQGSLLGEQYALLNVHQATSDAIWEILRLSLC